MQSLSGKLVLPDRVLEGSLHFNARGIERIEEGRIAPDAPYIFPGFIDIHTHGCGGYDVMGGQEEGILKMAEGKAAQGVTQFLPTTLSAPRSVLLEVLSSIHRAWQESETASGGMAGAAIVGVHLEGPFLSSGRYQGAQNPRYIHDPDWEEFQAYREASGDLIRLVTLAPERPGALDFIRNLARQKIRSSAGHTQASLAELRAGVAAGLGSATHLFNGMKEFNHYEPGCVGGVLINDDLYCEVIGDFRHLVPEALELALRCKPQDKLMFVSDSIFCSGLPDGEYLLGSLPILLKNQEARTKEAGGMAGSVVRMDEILSNLLSLFAAQGCEGQQSQRDLRPLGLPRIAAMLSSNQAAFLGLPRTGRIEQGCEANFAVFDRDFKLEKTLRNGALVFAS